MGTALDINKIKEENNIYYYMVCDFHPDKTQFYIAIDPQKKTVSYFINLDDIYPVTVIDFNVTEKAIPVPPWDKGLARIAFFLAGFQAYNAIQNNHFPMYMGKYS